MFTLAHLSDPHLGPLPQARTSQLMGKRILGVMNWRRHRRHNLGPATLGPLMDDMLAQGPDHICVSGDLTNVSLPDEFTTGALFLASLGTGQAVSVVPGNHDAYVRGARQLHLHHWAAHLAGDAAGGAVGEVPYPYVRRRGPVAVVGVSTAVATGPFIASGRVGRAQLQALAQVLEQLGREGLFRAVMIHHPVVDDGPWHRRLRDSAAFRRVLARYGAELVMHGHDHRTSLHHVAGPQGAIPVVGVPSASAGPRAVGKSGAQRAGGYALYRISGGPGAWQCEMERRGYGEAGHAISSLGRAMILPGAQ